MLLLIFREEAQVLINRKDEELRLVSSENQGLLTELLTHRAEIDRLGNENGILKQGIRIQQTLAERTRADYEQRLVEDRAVVSHAGAHAMEHIRRLESANLTLRLQLDQMLQSSSIKVMPHWGEGH
jgi:hypothetical protein